MTDSNIEDKLDLKNTKLVVLLVDDQPMVAEAIQKMLSEELEIEFHYCQESNRALRVAIQVQPTVILQDLVMPDIDGMTLVKQYRENLLIKNVPVIVLSNKEDPIYKSRAFSTGASDYLVKLPDRIELIARIKSHARSYLAQQQRDDAFRKLRKLQSQLELSNQELQRISCLDGLTGVANRRHFDSYIDQEWLRASRESSTLSLILVDIDYFKAYNDNYGHQAGDGCLQRVAKMLDDVLQRPGDMLARYGGEEFIVVLPNTDTEGASVIAETLWSKINTMEISHKFSLVNQFITISLGISSIIPSAASRPADLIAAADKALYSAKHQGRNRFVTSPAIDRRLVEKNRFKN